MGRETRNRSEKEAVEKTAVSQTLGSLHIFMHTWFTAQLHEHIRQSDHCTFTCTHQTESW